MRLISIVVLALVMVLGTAVVSPSVARADLSGCTQSVLPVSLGPGQPTDQQVFVQLCLPAGATPTQLAAYTVVSRVLLNLDETITKE